MQVLISFYDRDTGTIEIQASLIKQELDERKLICVT